MDASKAKKEAPKIKIEICLCVHVHLLFPIIGYGFYNEVFDTLSTPFCKIRYDR